MSREFIALAIHRATHEEIFRQLWQHDAEAAADAMEMEYDQEDLRRMKGLQVLMEDLDDQAAREFLVGITQQEEDIFGGPLRQE